MPAPRSPDELRTAVDSMFRIRAVESPPDANGLRTVWHRGAMHAELVSEIDLGGEVARHEFSLYDDVVVWERGRGFTTGEAKLEGSTRGASNVAFDLSSDASRLGRIAAALQPYAGRDRIIQHLRDLVLKTQAGVKPLRSLGVVTGSNPVAPAPSPAPPALPQAPLAARPRHSTAYALVALGLLLVVIAIAVLALK